MSKQKIPTFTTPLGRACFPYLNSPNYTHKKREGSIEVDLALEGVAAEEFKAKCDAWLEESKTLHKTNECGLPYKPEKDKDTGEPTGATLFKFWMPGLSNNNEPMRPKFFTASGQPDASEPKVGLGSTIAIKGSVLFTAYDGKAFIRMHPYNVQIANLVEFGGGGFDAVEGDYQGGTQATQQEDTFVPAGASSGPADY